MQTQLMISHSVRRAMGRAVRGGVLIEFAKSLSVRAFASIIAYAQNICMKVTLPESDDLQTV